MHNDLYKIRILVVEDQHLMRELTIEALNSIGFAAVEGVENGARALKQMQKQRFDVIVTDIEMKPVNGFELVRAIRAGQTSHPRGLPIIFLTGFSDVGTLSSAADLDVQVFIVKPVSAKLLREKVEQALNGETHLQPPAAYRYLRLASPGQLDGPVRHVAPGDEARKRTVDVLMLAEGMILEQDVRAKGNLLLKAGTRLLAPHIAVLLDMRALLHERRLEVSLPPEA